MPLPTGNPVAKGCGTCLVLLALGMGAWAGYTAARWTLAYRWPAVPCLILRSEVRDVGGHEPYRFEVQYRYAWRGRRYDGTTVRQEYRSSWDIAAADRLARTYPKDARRACYVNPRSPSEAILEHESPLTALAAAAAMLLCGACLARTLVVPGRGPEALSFLFVGLVGACGYVGFFGLPLWAGLRSLAWRPTPCVVRSAQVRSHHHSGQVPHTVYWPDVVYEYRVGGVAYRANTYNASDVGTLWYYGPRGVVRRYRPGAWTTCYVDPSDPAGAALTRHLSGTHWFGLWPLAMAALGAGGLLAGAGRRLIRPGSPRLWGTVALGAATCCALQVLLVTGGDLARDWREGVQEWPEVVAAAVAGLVAAGLLAGWVALACKAPWPPRRGQGAAGPKATLGVRDREIDG
jgi:hypothetical protein